MAFTINEALQLPVMQTAKLIAGHQGAQNNIKWVTIVELLVPGDIDRLQEGELLITTGFGIYETPERVKVFHDLLKSNKLSGLVICTSYYMKEVPRSFINAANENNLPIIEFPADINFSDITRAILGQIVNNQIHMLEYSINIHKELTKLVLNNRGLNEITNTLSGLTDSTIIIYNDLHEITHKKRTESNDSRIDKTTIHLGEELVDLRPILVQSLKEEKANHKVIPGFRITICPIIAKQNCYGWIAMIKTLDDWENLDEIAIEHAATIYAIEFLKKEAVEETKIRLQGGVLEEVFNQRYLNEKTIIEQGRELGYDLSLKQTVFYFTFERYDDLNKGLFQNLHHIIEQLFIQKGKQQMTQTKFSSLTLLTNVVGSNSEEVYDHCINLATEIKNQWLYFYPNNPIVIGIGNDYRNIHELSKSSSEAQYATKLSSLVYQDNGITHYSDLGMYDLLLKMKRNGISLKGIYSENLKSLLPTINKGVDFIETLDIYLMNNQSIKVTSNQLFIHRHTLSYRLNQIEIRTGLNLAYADDRLKLQLSVMAYKLSNLLGKDITT